MQKVSDDAFNASLKLLDDVANLFQTYVDTYPDESRNFGDDLTPEQNKQFDAAYTKFSAHLDSLL